MSTKRVAVIDKDKCKPTKCNFECKRRCPPQQIGKECISIVDIEDAKIPKKIAKINEDICISCGACANSKVGCPFGAIQMVNIPTELIGTAIHKFGMNGFRLYKMPILKPNQITGLLGQNGIGKSTIISILSNKLKPNFEGSSLSNGEIITKFKGTEMHKYMTKLYKNSLKVSVKPQHVDVLIPYLKSKNLDPTVMEYIKLKSDESDEWLDLVIKTLELDKIGNSKVNTLSGGELQRLVCATTLLTKSDVYIFDEPTNYLDIRKRLDVAKMIKMLVKPDVYVVVIEHDLTILDYLSDYICIVYGVPSAFGVVSLPLSTANAINIYFDGYIPAENMRFRETEYNLTGLNILESDTKAITNSNLNYDGGVISYDNFTLEIKDGTFPEETSITVILGENGSGKTTFINHLAKQIDGKVSHKPQYLNIDKFNKNGIYPTVGEYVMNNTPFTDSVFVTDVIKPMGIDKLTDRKINELSGGELQRFFITLCLGTDAYIYLIDEPSSMLDIEQRVITAKVLKRFAVHNKKILFVVEHDMMIAISLGSELNSQVIYMGVSNIEGKRTSTVNTFNKFSDGVNMFLKYLNITFRTESKLAKHKRPRINKLDSAKDKEQKASGNYYE